MRSRSQLLIVIDGIILIGYGFIVLVAPALSFVSVNVLLHVSWTHKFLDVPTGYSFSLARDA